MAKVSVLIAVYNTEQYLTECLDSLLGQTLRDIQVICIDDASTDASLALLRNYAAADKRIEIIPLDENHGQAYARNQGLKAACGEYVTFLDSDDWLSASALQQAVEVFERHEQTDCVLFQVDIVNPGHTERYAMPVFDSLSGEEAFRKSLDWQIHGVYMVRNSLHQAYPYDDTCRSFSDDNTTRIHYINSREVRQCDGIYFYRQHPSSTSHLVSVRHYDRLRADESLRDQLRAIGVGEGVLRQWETKRLLTLVDSYMFHYVHVHELSMADRSYGLSEMRRVWQGIDRRLLDPAKTRKFGYRLMPRWWMFRLQEWLYFTLRSLAGRNTIK